MRAFCGRLLSGSVAGLFAINGLLAGEIAAPAATPGNVAVATAPVPPAAAAPTMSTPQPPVPAGTLYLVAPASVRTPSGIIGFAPGQGVRLVRTDSKTGRLLVTDGQYQVEVTPAQLTADARIAATLRQREEVNRRAAQAAQEASLLAQKRHEAALKRIELNRDVEMASHIVPQAPPKQTMLYDRPYGLRGDPYHAEHTIIPPVQGPHSVPGSLATKSNGLGFY